MNDPEMLSVHSRLARSRCNGPGVRAVIWLQGCRRGCPGCFNLDTHAHDGRNVAPVADLVRWVLDRSAGVEGITVSGGEPMEQAEGLIALLRAVRLETDLSVVLFSGFTLDQIRRHRLGPEILSHVDVLIDGPYDASQPLKRGMRGSANQQVHLLSDRYTADDIARVPVAEAIVAADGAVTISGVSPPRSRLK